MTVREVRITNPMGFHARPGNRFVKEAKKFSCAITIRKGDLEVNAKSLLSLLKAGISQDDLIQISCSGPDEDNAVEELVAFVRTLTE
jgi:phosphotransferase system HPr (HPr) family protein